MQSRKSRTIPEFAARCGSCLLAGALLIAPAGAAPQPPSLSKPGADPAPAVPPLALEEVFVTSAPRKTNEAQTIKEAYAKVKNGGVIFITEKKSDISNDGSALIITRPVTIALDPDLKIRMAIERDDNFARAEINAAADGVCVIVGQDERGDGVGRRVPRNEVTIKDVEFAPSPAGAAGNCIEVFDGRLFLDNVAIATGKTVFRKGVVINGGDVITNNRIYVKASKIGFEVRSGALEIANGAEIKNPASDAAQAPPPTISCKDAIKNFSIGVFAGVSADARTGDPTVNVKGATISGFDYGICAAGDGVNIDSAKISRAGIGVRSDKQTRLASSRISSSSTAAFVAGSDEAEAVDNEFFNSGSGAIITGGSPATFKRNLFAFNQTAIAFGQAYIKDDETLRNFTGNSVFCNANAGSLANWRRFKRANERKDNGVKICSGAKQVDRCRDLRKTLGLSATDCGGR